MAGHRLQPHYPEGWDLRGGLPGGAPWPPIDTRRTRGGTNSGVKKVAAGARRTNADDRSAHHSGIDAGSLRNAAESAAGAAGSTQTSSAASGPPVARAPASAARPGARRRTSPIPPVTSDCPLIPSYGTRRVNREAHARSQEPAGRSHARARPNPASTSGFPVMPLSYHVRRHGPRSSGWPDPDAAPGHRRVPRAGPSARSRLRVDRVSLSFSTSDCVPWRRILRAEPSSWSPDDFSRRRRSRSHFVGVVAPLPGGSLAAASVRASTDARHAGMGFRLGLIEGSPRATNPRQR
jgi:hypothetical protein